MATSTTTTQPQSLVPPPRSKTTTRTSIRQTFGLASVSKAFADAIHKEPRPSSRQPKDSATTAAAPAAPAPTRKEATSSRRLSSGIAVRPSLDRPPSVVFPRESIDTVSRRGTVRIAQKMSSAPSVDSTRTTSDSGPSEGEPSRRVTRSRTAALSGVSAPPPAAAPPPTQNAASAVPRPRGMSKPPPLTTTSPVRPSQRRKLSEDDSWDEIKDDGLGVKDIERAISPLPRRAGIKVNLTANIKAASASVKPSKPPVSAIAPPSRSQTPLRPPSTTIKKPSPPSAVGSTIARPSSAQSIRSVAKGKVPHAQVPSTPTGRSLRGTLFGRSSPTSKTGGLIPAPTASRPSTRNNSPPERNLLKSSQTSSKSSKSSTISSPLSDVTATPTKMPFMEGDSMDSIDVEHMLSLATSPGGATPAMPRIQVTEGISGPETPTRPDPLGLSVLSQLPPNPNGSLLLRPQQSHYVNDRSSMTLDQLTAHGARGLGESEMDSMLADITAPFPPGMMSPVPSHMSFADPPGSPAFQGMFTSAGPFAQSIAEIILPEMTPSPAPRRDLFDSVSRSSSTTARDDAQATLLRLQVASAENVAKQRLSTIQALEQQLEATRAAHEKEIQQLSQRVSHLDAKLRENVQAREQTDAEQAARLADLEMEISRASVLRKEAVGSAVSAAQKAARVQRTADLERHHQRWTASSTANRAAGRWAVVYEVADAELELIETNKETLATLLASIDLNLARLKTS